jgi:endonuclease-8
MPEGDTIHRAARTLRVALADQVIRRFASTRILSRDLVGRRFTSIEAHGKHLLLRLDDGRAIQAHMGMTGSMHVYRPGERWLRSEGAARMVIEVEGWVVVAFSVPTLRLVVANVETPRALAHLGPDVLAADFGAPAAEEARRRLRARADLPLGVAIMDQTALAGVGNIYKSETLFTLGLDPFAPVSAFDDETLAAVVARARRLMSSNLRGAMRTTTRNQSQRFYVYERKGKACLRCPSIVEMRRQGEQARSTYYCPQCQLGRTSAR